MGNVYMEADQVRFKDSTYRNVQEGLTAALEGGGGGTTVVANPEGSATADLAKLQVGTTIYGIPETAAKVTYDNTSSGLTADDVQEAIDEIAGDIPDAVTGNPSGSATAGNLTKLQIGSDIYNVPSGGSGGYDVIATIEILKSDLTLDSGSGNYSNSTHYEFSSAERAAIFGANLCGVYVYSEDASSAKSWGNAVFSFKAIPSNLWVYQIINNGAVVNPHANIGDFRIMIHGDSSNHFYYQLILSQTLYDYFESGSKFVITVVKIA